MDEIFKERAEYLVNIDDLMFEMYGEPIFDKRTGISHEAPFYSGNIDLANKVKVDDKFFASKEYQKYLYSHLTHPEDISKQKFQPDPHKKLRSDELQDFDTIIED